MRYRTSPFAELAVPLVVAALSHGCTRSGSPSQADPSNPPTVATTIPCRGPDECVAPLVCDTAAGLCTSADGSVYTCSPPVPGCGCATGALPIQCVAPGLDPQIGASCFVGISDCNGATYGTCVLGPIRACTSAGAGEGQRIPIQLPPTPAPGSTTEPPLDNVRLDSSGAVVLAMNEDSRREFGFLWVANSSEGTVSKVDVETGREVARYAAARDTVALGLPPAPTVDPENSYDTSRLGNWPSRTAIDFRGNAYVANRAFGQQGSVTKFANALADCVDRNQSGTIETSTDANNDGVIDLTSPMEFFGEADECILYTVLAGNNRALPRGIAVDGGDRDNPDGNVWVALFNRRTAIQLSGKTGALRRTVELVDGAATINPYGAAVDGVGNVWFPSLSDGYAMRVTPSTGTVRAVQIPTCGDSYGIVVDLGGRIWLGGYSCNAVHRIDPITLSVKSFPTGGANGSIRGVAVDLANNVWVAHTGARVSKLPYTPASDSMGTPVVYNLEAAQAGTNHTIGVGVDRFGKVWGVNRNDDSNTGTVTRIDPGIAPGQPGAMQFFPVGVNPYTYSDFTGFGLLSVVRPSGFFRTIVQGCPTTPTTPWKTLSWTQDTPPGTSIQVKVRTGATVAELEAAPFEGPFTMSPRDLPTTGISASKLLQLEFDLTTQDAAITPRLTGFNVDFDCPSGVD
jgi:hypothetical protein